VEERILFFYPGFGSRDGSLKILFFLDSKQRKRVSLKPFSVCCLGSRRLLFSLISEKIFTFWRRIRRNPKPKLFQIVVKIN